MNGAAARLVHPGDRVIVVSYGATPSASWTSHEPRVVHVDEDNPILRVDADPASARARGGPMSTEPAAPTPARATAAR